jgi:hypothetical protein
MSERLVDPRIALLAFLTLQEFPGPSGPGLFLKVHKNQKTMSQNDTTNLEARIADLTSELRKLKELVSDLRWEVGEVKFELDRQRPKSNSRVEYVHGRGFIPKPHTQWSK